MVFKRKPTRSKGRRLCFGIGSIARRSTCFPCPPNIRYADQQHADLHKAGSLLLLRVPDRGLSLEGLPLTDPACVSAVEALLHDPFYRSITSDFGSDEPGRRTALTHYFDYSIRQGARIGRVVHPDDADAGVAVWILPQTIEVRHQETLQKHQCLREILGERGCANYDRIVEYMGNRAGAVIEAGSWYLSIVAVAPQAQGRGLGARLLAPTLAEVDKAGAVCYLETFNPRSVAFYERLGFVTRAQFDEPTTLAQYAIMVRTPRRDLSAA